MSWEPIISGIIGGGLISSLIALFMLFQIKEGNTREAFFKCLDEYFKIMDYRSKAIIDKKCETYFDYYRALFDLQWSEYHMWLRGSIPDTPYRIWIELRNRQYLEKCQECINEVGKAENTNYRIVWERLLKESYYTAKDPFVAHMNLVHEGKFDEAMNEKYEHYKFKPMIRLRKRLNR